MRPLELPKDPACHGQGRTKSFWDILPSEAAAKAQLSITLHARNRLRGPLASLCFGSPVHQSQTELEMVSVS